MHWNLPLKLFPRWLQSTCCPPKGKVAALICLPVTFICANNKSYGKKGGRTRVAFANSVSQKVTPYTLPKKLMPLQITGEKKRLILPPKLRKGWLCACRFGYTKCMAKGLFLPSAIFLFSFRGSYFSLVIFGVLPSEQHVCLHQVYPSPSGKYFFPSVFLI